MARRVVVDGANVVGSVPDGWWRDRAGAARRLVERLEARGEPVTVVLEGAARAGVGQDHAGAVTVVHAPGSGDDTIAALAGPDVLVVTADRGLAARVRAAGAEVAGPRSLD